MQIIAYGYFMVWRLFIYDYERYINYKYCYIKYSKVKTNFYDLQLISLALQVLIKTF